MNPKEPSIAEQKMPSKGSMFSLLKGKNPLFLVGIAVLLVFTILLGITFFASLVSYYKNYGNKFSQNNTDNLSKNKKTVLTPTATPTPMPLPVGPQTYSVSSRNNIQVKELVVSSLNTKIGDSQSMSLNIQDPQAPVVSVNIKLITDKKSTDYSLKLTSGTGSDGVWESSWTTNDTHDYKYQALITIKDQKGNVFTFEPSFR